MKTGTYTGKSLKVTDKMWALKGKYKEVTIGKISGYNGTGAPVYDLLDDSGKKVGEMGNGFIKQYLKQQQNEGVTMKNEIDKSLELILKEGIHKYLNNINEQQMESEYERIQNQPPEYNVYAMMKLLNKHGELKKEFMNYKQLYSRKNSNMKATEVIFRNYVLNDPAFEREYREILDDFQGRTTEKLPPTLTKGK